MNFYYTSLQSSDRSGNELNDCSQYFYIAMEEARERNFQLARFSFSLVTAVSQSKWRIFLGTHVWVLATAPELLNNFHASDNTNFRIPGITTKKKNTAAFFRQAETIWRNISFLFLRQAAVFEAHESRHDVSNVCTPSIKLYVIFSRIAWATGNFDWQEFPIE